jgi:hypothetical protein
LTYNYSNPKDELVLDPQRLKIYVNNSKEHLMIELKNRLHYKTVAGESPRDTLFVNSMFYENYERKNVGYLSGCRELIQK